MYLSSDHRGRNPDPQFVLRNNLIDVTALTYFEIDGGKQLLISGSVDGMVRFWDIGIKRPFIELKASKGNSILYLEVFNIHSNWLLISQDRSGNVVLWNMDKLINLEDEECWKISDLGFCSISVLQKGNELLVAFPKNQSSVGIKKYSKPSNNDFKTLDVTDKQGMMMGLELFEKNNTVFLLSGHENGNISLWNVTEGYVLSSVKLFDDPIMAFVVDSKSTKLIATSATDKLQVVGITDSKELFIESTIDLQFSGCSSICLRPDNKIVLVGGWDGKVRIFTWKKMKLLAVLKYHTGTINCMSFDKDNNFFIGSKDGRISLWDLYNDK